MDLQLILSQAWALVQEHWPKAAAALASLVIGSWWGRRRARREWAQKRFLDRINFSLNILRDGRLQIRTLAEMNCRDVFLNDVAVEQLLACAAKTTADDPVIPIKGDDRWYFLNSVLNEVSERFSTGFLKRDMGLPVTTAPYLVCLTYENSGPLRTRKIRAMIVRKDVLLNLPTDDPQLEMPHHSQRVLTLRAMRASYGRDPSNFLEVEVSL